MFLFKFNYFIHFRNVMYAVREARYTKPSGFPLSNFAAQPTLLHQEFLMDLIPSLLYIHLQKKIPFDWIGFYVVVSS